MFTLRRGTALIITAGPGHIKGLRKGQTFCRSATVSRPASAHANTNTKGRLHTLEHPLGIYAPTKNMTALCSAITCFGSTETNKWKSKQCLRQYQSCRIVSFKETRPFQTSDAQHCWLQKFVKVLHCHTLVTFTLMFLVAAFKHTYLCVQYLPHPQDSAVHKVMYNV